MRLAHLPRFQLPVIILILGYWLLVVAQTGNSSAVLISVGSGQELANAAAEFWQANPPHNDLLQLTSSLTSLAGSIFTPLQGNASIASTASFSINGQGAGVSVLDLANRGDLLLPQSPGQVFCAPPLCCTSVYVVPACMLKSRP